MWQTLGSIDLVTSQHEWFLGSIVMWETLQKTSDRDYFKTQILLETSKTRSRHQEPFCAFSEVEPLFQEVGMQETNGSLTQFHRVRGSILRRWLAHGRQPRNGMGFGHCSFALIINIMRKHGETRCDVSTVWETSANPNEVETSHVGRGVVWERLITSLRTHNFLTTMLCCTFFWGQRGSDQNDNQGKKPYHPACHEPTEFLLTGCWTESMWTPTCRSNTLTPDANSRTSWPKAHSPVKNRIILFSCLT